MLAKKKRSLRKQRCTIIEKEDGLYGIKAPPLRGLVLSGGGAKGVLYAGMVKSMAERGFLKDLTHVSGASAGAMTVSLLAIGMDHTNITKLIGKANLMNIIDGGLANMIANRELRLRASGDCLCNMLEMVYIQQIREHLAELERPNTIEGAMAYDYIQAKINAHRTHLHSLDIEVNNLDDIIALAESKTGIKKLKAFNKQATLSTLTFADLTILRNLFPEDKKHLFKHLSVVTTNQTKSKKITHSETLTPSDSISRTVQFSAAHPLLFTPGRNAHGDYIADGGISDNMPSKALKQLGLQNEEILCVRVVSASSYQSHLAKIKNPEIQAGSASGNALDAIARPLFGDSPIKRAIKTINREKIFYHLGNMLFLDSGPIQTTSVEITPLQKKLAHDSAEKQTEAFFKAHNQDSFDNPLLAMLFIDKPQLEELKKAEDPLVKKLLPYMEMAEAILGKQEAAVEALNNKDSQLGLTLIKQIEGLLETTDLTKLQQEKAMALCLKQVNYLSHGQFETSLAVEHARAVAAEAPERNWLQRLWDLLVRAICWVISLFTPQRPQEAESAVEPERKGLLWSNLFYVNEDREPELLDEALLQPVAFS